jgi:formate/nitrite transporter FocA (FNT family)
VVCAQDYRHQIILDYSR